MTHVVELYEDLSSRWGSDNSIMSDRQSSHRMRYSSAIIRSKSRRKGGPA
jgi:hypothetical protein